MIPATATSVGPYGGITWEYPQLRWTIELRSPKHKRTIIARFALRWDCMIALRCFRKSNRFRGKWLVYRAGSLTAVKP